MNDAEAVDTVVALLEASGLTEAEYRNDVPARIALEIAFDAPGRKAAQIRCPILFCVCDADGVAPAKATLRHAAKAPRAEIRRYPVGHFDIYMGEQFERVVADQLAFLHTHVPTAATS
jgi:pimeloyl-ACP methyl ester carboxylesterase